jgi:hypothetical protein
LLHGIQFCSWVEDPSTRLWSLSRPAEWWELEIVVEKEYDRTPWAEDEFPDQGADLGRKIRIVDGLIGVQADGGYGKQIEIVAIVIVNGDDIHIVGHGELIINFVERGQDEGSLPQLV